MTLVNASVKAPVTAMGTFCVLLGSVLMAQTSPAPCADKTGFAKQACEVEAGHVAAVPEALGSSKAELLTTNASDTLHADTLPPSFEPETFRPLIKLGRTDDGSFLLKAGIYEAYVQSFSLDTAGWGGARVGGYYPAPIKGRRAKVISDALKQSELHPDVPQGDIQALLWAIVHGIDLEAMPAPVQQTAARILPKETLSLLKGSTSAKAVENRLLGILNRRLEKNPQVQEEQSEAKQIDREYGISDTVQAAKGGSGAPIPASPDPVLRGTWAQMPGGFYVRYLPEATLKIRVQVMVPDEAVSQANPKTPLSFDPTQCLAVFAGSPAQRLGVSLRGAK